MPVSDADKQLAAQIIAAMLSSRSGPAMFNATTPKDQQFEAIWKRILEAVAPPQTPDPAAHSESGKP